MVPACACIYAHMCVWHIYTRIHMCIYLYTHAEACIYICIWYAWSVWYVYYSFRCMRCIICVTFYAQANIQYNADIKTQEKVRMCAFAYVPCTLEKNMQNNLVPYNVMPCGTHKKQSILSTTKLMHIPGINRMPEQLGKYAYYVMQNNENKNKHHKTWHWVWCNIRPIICTFYHVTCVQYYTATRSNYVTRARCYDMYM